jgi:hypothetical protein
MRDRATKLLTLLVVSLPVLAGSASAHAETPAPWWGVTSGARPTNLSGDSGKDEVQRLTVTGTKGDYLLIEFTKFGECGLCGVAVVPFDATAADVQQTFERLYPAPARRVIVTEEPSGEEDTRTYKIIFPAQAVAPPFALADNAELAESFGGEPLTRGEEPGEASLTEIAAGAETVNEVVVIAENRGDASTGGEATVTDKLPPGLQAVAIEGRTGESNRDRGPVRCTIKTLTCAFAETCTEAELLKESKCVLPPYEQIEVDIQVVPESGARGQNTATASGGGAAQTVTASQPIDSRAKQAFGFEDYQLIPENVGGSVDTQAGSHPFQLTSVVTLNTQTPDEQGKPRTVALPKDIVSELPPGLIGNPTPFKQCTDAQFAKQPPAEENGELRTINECPADTAVGVASITFNEPQVLSFVTTKIPIFNLTPRPGEPARFGFKVEGFASAFLDTSLRTGGDYGVTVTSSNINQIAWVLSAKLTFWGVPGDPRHDGQRGWDCLEGFGTCQASTESSPPPFLVMPTSCELPYQSTLRGDSWGSSARAAEQAESRTYRMPEAIDGCNQLPFSPSVKVTPDGTATSTPTGLNVDVHVPQTSVLDAESLAESAVRNITVALPEGVAVNPAGGDGLQACSESQVGYLPPPESEPPESLHFTPALAEPFCPDASKIGTVTISTPLLPKGQDLTGAVYLAAQNQNPFGSLIALYIVAEDPVSGAVVKLPGETRLTGSGQIIGTFESTPQLAFEDAELHFFGGERAPLATPAHCGPYTTNATFTPWSGNGQVSSSSTFDITSGPNGTPCPGQSLPFSPSLTGGTTNIKAGAFTQLTTTIGRPDGHQDMQSVTLHMPPGLSGLLSGVKLCPEAQANDGTCGPESLIGETTVSAGVGSDPVSVTGGRVYITEHYAGSPFGLSIVNPVKAGPFDLEHDTSNPAQQPACDCVVVRARIDVDPTTAALTITTDPAGPHAVPHMIDGIPVQIKNVNVLINRPGFTFNPTNCDPMAITGSITGDEGASSPVSVPFQVHDCAVLKFAPKFTVSTSGRTSKAAGASLTAKLTEPAGSIGTQANLTKVKVELPRQLPSQLKTLQKACLAKVFNANPADCPPESIVGHATVHTPLVPVPLTGPAYFVSHGGEEFPSLTIVLQGYGVTVELVGSTFISKKGITSSTFKTVPDTPFNSFELSFPQGKYAALGANLPAKAHGSFCGQNLKMPIEMIAQNGMAIYQNTPITVTGCAKPTTRAQRLAAALKACKKLPLAKRVACRRAARKRYGAVKRKK